LVGLGNKPELLFDLADTFWLRQSNEAMPALSEKFCHPGGKIAASKVNAQNSTVDRVAFAERTCVGGTVAGIDDVRNDAYRERTACIAA
jgi:hypothetical protein